MLSRADLEAARTPAEMWDLVVRISNDRDT